jgi:hypothetical protein
MAKGLVPYSEKKQRFVKNVTAMGAPTAAGFAGQTEDLSWPTIPLRLLGF